MKEKKRIFGYGAVGAGLFLLVLAVVGINYRTSDFVGGWDSDSFSKRISLNLVALKMWKENYMLGVGAGNFVAKLPEYQRDSKFYWLQPVHNIFLLLGTELGVLGIILIIKMLITNYKLQITKKNWLIFGVVAVTGMVDHYWITLPQNFWLLIVVLGIL